MLSFLASAKMRAPMSPAKRAFCGANHYRAIYLAAAISDMRIVLLLLSRSPLTLTCWPSNFLTVVQMLNQQPLSLLSGSLTAASKEDSPAFVGNGSERRQ
jgi:hypothetical protein